MSRELSHGSRCTEWRGSAGRSAPNEFADVRPRRERPSDSVRDAAVPPVQQPDDRGGSLGRYDAAQALGLVVPQRPIEQGLDPLRAGEPQLSSVTWKSPHNSILSRSATPWEEAADGRLRGPSRVAYERQWPPLASVAGMCSSSAPPSRGTAPSNSRFKIGRAADRVSGAAQRSPAGRGREAPHRRPATTRPPPPPPPRPPPASRTGPGPDRGGHVSDATGPRGCGRNRLPVGGAECIRGAHRRAPRLRASLPAHASRATDSASDGARAACAATYATSRAPA